MDDADRIARDQVGDANKVIAGLRRACAAGGRHGHDGCSCSDAELLGRAVRLQLTMTGHTVEEIMVDGEVVEK